MAITTSNSTSVKAARQPRSLDDKIEFGLHEKRMGLSFPSDNDQLFMPEKPKHHRRGMIAEAPRSTDMPLRQREAFNF
ncbi:MAG: hypothetical protein AB7G28_06595 [Pirellulales bacterium]